MPKSPAFARIKADVLTIIASIPEGSLVSYRGIGLQLDVMPRHVAYILATLDEHEKLLCPWHRVVGENGRLGKLKRLPNGRTQADMLRDEGFTIARDAVAEFAQRVVDVAELGHCVPQQTRPDAQPMKRRL